MSTTETVSAAGFVEFSYPGGKVARSNALGLAFPAAAARALGGDKTGAPTSILILLNRAGTETWGDTVPSPGDDLGTAASIQSAGSLWIRSGLVSAPVVDAAGSVVFFFGTGDNDDSGTDDLRTTDTFYHAVLLDGLGNAIARVSLVPTKGNAFTYNPNLSFCVKWSIAFAV